MTHMLNKLLSISLLTLLLFGFGMPRAARACPS
jgi:hypothetical protein